MGQTRSERYVLVALNVPLPGPFHYRLPDPLREVVTLGARVRVSFGRRKMAGYCVGFSDMAPIAENRIKDIGGVIDRPALLDRRMLDLTRWMAEYYCCSWGEALEAALPAGVRKAQTSRTLTMVSAAKSDEELLARAEEVEKRAPRQARVLRVLSETEGEISAPDLLSLAEADYAVMAALRRDGYAAVRKQRVTDDASLDFGVEHVEPPTPTAEQAAVLERIRLALDKGGFHVMLLHGVTGSGKTEVYLQTLKRVVESGRQGIVLVPEIALTPQTVARFRARFDRVCVLHSELSERGRREQWRKIRRGEADVVIGARSAVFAPVPQLGLLVVDEEHESTFKQENVPRYHGRDVGIWRASREGALTILGSATPSLESYRNAQTGKYEMLELERRVEGRPLPPVIVQDMRGEVTRFKKTPMLSRRMGLEIESVLQKGEQAILLLNRRGFHTFVSCKRCGYVVQCPHCDVSLTYHRGRHESARCHYCAYETTPPDICPSCGKPGIRYGGSGTQRVAETLAERFGEEAVARMDSDAMRGRGKYEATLSDFRDGKTRILLGTQMVAKGLDFPNVTLVGVVNADVSLNLPDFRASERTFQLLSQVSGRAGRGPKGGRVIVQTMNPEDPCILLAAKHDYLGFARREMKARRQFGYPPFARIARVLVEGRKAAAVEERCTKAVETLRAVAAETKTQILGPAEAPIGRVKDRYRWHALVKAPDSASLHAALDSLERTGPRGTTLIIDVDPVSLL